MRIFFVVLLIACAGFILYTGQQMPPTVASHFGPSGTPTTTMPRAAYLTFMITVTILTPILIVLVGQLIRILPVSLINLPHREYWLGAERRESTIRALSAPALWLGSGLAVLLAFAHWQVVRANLRTDPELNAQAIWIALVVLAIGALAWLVWLIVRFTRVPH